MFGKMTFAFLVLLSCLTASMIAAPLADSDRSQQKGNEIGDLFRDRPSQMKLRTVSRPEEIDSTKASANGRGTEAKAENGILQSIFGTVLAFPNYVAASLEGLLNGVVGRLLGGGQQLKTSDSEDFR